MVREILANKDQENWANWPRVFSQFRTTERSWPKKVRGIRNKLPVFESSFGVVDTDQPKNENQRIIIYERNRPTRCRKEQNSICKVVVNQILLQLRKPLHILLIAHKIKHKITHAVQIISDYSSFSCLRLDLVNQSSGEKGETTLALGLTDDVSIIMLDVNFMSC